MNRSLCLASVFCIVTSIIAAQEHQVGEAREMSSGIRRRAVVLNINVRVLDEQVVIWDEVQTRVAIPGSPVSIQLGGLNVIIAVQFTPFIRRNDKILVAQAQIWISDPEQGVSYYTSIQTIPLEFDEPIFFFPLGQSAGTNHASLIEIIITVSPYTVGTTPTPEAKINTENDE